MSTSKIQLVYAKCRVGLLLISVGVCLCFGLLFANIAALRNKDSTVILFPFLPTPGRNSVSFNLVLRPRKYFGFSRLIFLKWRNSQAETGHTHPFPGAIPWRALDPVTLPWVSAGVPPEETASSHSWIQLIAPSTVLWTLKRGDHWLQLLPLMVNESLILGAAVFLKQLSGWLSLLLLFKPRLHVSLCVRFVLNVHYWRIQREDSFYFSSFLVDCLKLTDGRELNHHLVLNSHFSVAHTRTLCSCF